MSLQCIFNLNNIPETNQMKTTFSLKKLKVASQKSICLEFHTPFTINTHTGVVL